MTATDIIFYILMFFWLFSEIYYKTALASNKTDQKGKDKSTLTILWITIFCAIFFSIFVARGFSAFTISGGPVIPYIGLVLIAFGLVARVVIIKALGRFFTVDVTIREGHQLKKNGFYKIIRHPSYAMSLLTFLGLGLYLDNWISLIIAFVPPFLAFSLRIKVEEKALTEQFGEEYVQYKKTTKKLIPFVY